jgi:hypothetical protein
VHVPQKNHEYPSGLDCTWIASDSVGNLAAFITAGVGPVPISVLDPTLPLLPDWEDTLLSLPIVSPVSVLAQVPSQESYRGIASRGFFVFDWTDFHRPVSSHRFAYELVARPGEPACVTTLPPALHRLAVAVRFGNLVFSEHTQLDVVSRVRCVDGRETVPESPQ